MKVGIITYHDTANYGAAFQAIATFRYISSLGYDAEVINYTNTYREGSYDIVGRVVYLMRAGKFVAALKNAVAGGMIISRNKRFSRFYSNNMRVSKQKYIGDSITSFNLNYDAYVAGSDQIWNFANNGGDPNYALSFVENDSIKISYASSFGMSTIVPEMRADFGDALKKITYPSVREETGADIFRTLTGVKPTVVLDPVFLLDRQEWEGVAKNGSATNGAVVTYLSDVKYLREFKNVAGDLLENKKILQFGSDISINEIFNINSKFVASLGPEEFLAHIAVASTVITSSFHGVVLSIIFERKFVVFLSGNNGRDSRIVDLLYSLGLEKRIFDSNTVRDVICEEIDYQSVKIKLNDKISSSKHFLESSLREVKSGN